MLCPEGTGGAKSHSPAFFLKMSSFPWHVVFNSTPSFILSGQRHGSIPAVSFKMQTLQEKVLHKSLQVTPLCESARLFNYSADDDLGMEGSCEERRVVSRSPDRKNQGKAF